MKNDIVSCLSSSEVSVLVLWFYTCCVLTVSRCVSPAACLEIHSDTKLFPGTLWQM